MQVIRISKALHCAAIFFSLFLFLAKVDAQTPAQPALPKEPRALLELAAQANGLGSHADHPWHLVAKVSHFDDKGAESQHGTYEIFWQTPQRFKIIYNSGSFQQTALRTAEGTFLSGSTGPVPEYLLLDANQLLAPIPASLPLDNPKNDKVEIEHLKAGNQVLDCLSLKFKNTSFGDMTGPSYCLSSGTTFLRAVTNFNGMSQVLFNQLNQFDGHIVAYHRVEVWNQKKNVEVEITLLEELKTADAVEKTPAAGSRKAPELVELTSGSGVNLSVKKIPPNYPVSAKERHIQGTVVMHARIDQQGRVQDLRPLSGPAQLQPAAIQAVSQWRFRPCAIYGETAAYETTINVIFTLGN